MRENNGCGLIVKSNQIQDKMQKLKFLKVPRIDDLIKTEFLSPNTEFKHIGTQA